MGRRLPAHMVEGELANADEWESWLFVPHERATEELIEHSFIPQTTASRARTPGTRSTPSPPPSVTRTA